MTQRYDDVDHHQDNDLTDAKDSLHHEQPHKQILEQLLIGGHVSAKNINQVARVLGLYPSRQIWLTFVDKMLLVFGSVSLVLAIVFFIAYNWINMGTLSKFALVESALVISVVGYSVLAYKNAYKLVQQLLLLIASIITGSLLALFGQVYQTGADSWQLFASWALLITPWVLIARMPALWLIWIGLINISFGQFFDIFGWTTFLYALSTFKFTYLSLLFAFNFIAFNLWLVCTSRPSRSETDYAASNSQTELNNHLHSFIDNLPTDKLKLNWSTYVVGLITTYYATSLGALHAVWSDNLWVSLIAFIIWLGFCGFIYWRFRKKQIDLLMLTALCGSAIIVLMFGVFKFLIDELSTLGFLILTLVLVGTSSAAVSWLNKLRKLDSASVRESDNLLLPQNKRGNDNE